MPEDTAPRCSRHPDRPASAAVVTHYVYDPADWRTVLRGTQLLGELCPDCRLELIKWICTPAEKAPQTSETPTEPRTVIVRLRYDDGTLSDDSTVTTIEHGYTSPGLVEWWPADVVRLRADKKGNAIVVFSTEGEELLWTRTHSTFGPGDAVEFSGRTPRGAIR